MKSSVAHRFGVLATFIVLMAQANDPRLRAASAFPPVELKLAFPNLIVNRPITICEAPDKTGRLFLVDQAGRLLILPKDRNSSAKTNVAKAEARAVSSGSVFKTWR